MPIFPTVTPITEFRHDGGFLISEARGMRSRDQGNIAQYGQRLMAGMVMGLITLSTGEIFAKPGNTGNPTFSSIVLETGAQDGTYEIVCLTATTASVTDPLGNPVGTLTFGSAFSTQIGVTITAGGTACVAGDSFYVDVSIAPAAKGAIAPGPGNTGNPTFSAIVPEAAVKMGVYKIVCTAATTATVYDPTGAVVGTLTFGSAFSTQIGVTITAGTVACVAGDNFLVTITEAIGAGGEWAPFDPTKSDGTQTAAGILFGMVDVTNEGFYGTIVTRECEVNAAELMWSAGVTTLAQQQTAMASLLALGIVARLGAGGLHIGA